MIMKMSKALLNIEHNFQTITHPAQNFDAFSKTGYKVPKWYLWNVSGKQALKKDKEIKHKTIRSQGHNKLSLHRSRETEWKPYYS